LINETRKSDFKLVNSGEDAVLSLNDDRDLATLLQHPTD